jgi:glycosyltransferase involved in cell wall biosynthesis
MRVLHVVRWPVGGIRTFFRYVYGRPEYAGMEMLAVGPDHGEFGAFVQDFLGPERLRFQVAGDGGAHLIRAVRTTLKDFRPDLLHSHGFSAGALAEVARTGSHVPHLMTAHDVFLPSSFAGWRGRLRRTGLDVLFRRITHVHAVSEDCADNFREYFPAVPAERVTAILHGIDAHRFRSAPAEELRASLGLPPDARVIGFFGRFMGQKGFRTLVDAMARLRDRGQPDFPLHVATFGWGGFIREDYAYLDSLGLSDRFHQQPGTDAPERWMKACDAIAMPSRWEACGLLAMEVLCAGVPLVGTSCIGLREVLANTPASTVEPADPDALAEALLAQLTPGAAECASAFADEACRRFDIARPAARLRELYEALAPCAA